MNNKLFLMYSVYILKKFIKKLAFLFFMPAVDSVFKLIALLPTEIKANEQVVEGTINTQTIIEKIELNFYNK